MPSDLTATPMIAVFAKGEAARDGPSAQYDGSSARVSTAGLAGVATSAGRRPNGHTIGTRRR